MIWTSAQVREAFEKKATELGLSMPQMQTLLRSQERFLARLYQLKESRYYVWKGGSLILRLYQYLEVPRFTVDIDFLVKGTEIAQVQSVLLEAMKIDFVTSNCKCNSFVFIDIFKSCIILTLIVHCIQQDF